MNLMSTSARAPVDLHSLKVIVPSTVDSVAFVKGRISYHPRLPAETPPLFSDRAIYRMGSGSGRPVDAAATVEMVETSDSIWSCSLICHRQPITGRSAPLQVLVKDRAVDFMGSCTRRPIDLAIFKVLHASATDARYRILAVQWRSHGGL